MPTIALSDMTVRTLPSPAKGQLAYWDDKLPSFGVRVSQGGSKTFVVKISNRFQALGRFGVITLSEARTVAKQLFAEKTLGKKRAPSMTYAAALAEFLEQKEQTRRPRTVEDLTFRIKQHFSFKGQIGDITHAEFQRQLKKVPTKSERDHALSVAKTFFNWAENERYITDNPTRGIKPYGKKKRLRVLTDQELRTVWLACEHFEKEAVDNPDPPLSTTYCAIVKMLILAGQRCTETASIRREYFDGSTGRDASGTITLPDTLTKNHEEHTLPLGPMAIALIRERLRKTNGAMLFPASRLKSGKDPSDTPFSGWSKSKLKLDALISLICEAQGLDDWPTLRPWVHHDLRRTFRTNLGKIGVFPHIAERVVNHISHRTDVERIYDMWKYLPEMRDAIGRYEAYLQQK